MCQSFKEWDKSVNWKNTAETWKNTAKTWKNTAVYIYIYIYERNQGREAKTHPWEAAPRPRQWFRWSRRCRYRVGRRTRFWRPWPDGQTCSAAAVRPRPASDRSWRNRTRSSRSGRSQRTWPGEKGRIDVIGRYMDVEDVMGEEKLLLT